MESDQLMNTFSILAFSLIIQTSTSSSNPEWIRANILDGFHKSIGRLHLNDRSSIPRLKHEPQEYTRDILAIEKRENQRYFHIKDLIHKTLGTEIMHLTHTLIFESQAPLPIQKLHAYERCRLRYGNFLRQLLLSKAGNEKIPDSATLIGLSLAVLLLDSKISLLKTPKLLNYTPLLLGIYRLAASMVRYQQTLNGNDLDTILKREASVKDL
jgi:hypothetical protein